MSTADFNVAVTDEQRADWKVNVVGVDDDVRAALTTIEEAVQLNSQQSVRLEARTSSPLVTLSDIAGATGIREQDSVVYDPGDTNAAHLWKFYVSVTFPTGNIQRIYVVFSADGATWGAPVPCTLGAGTRRAQDPSVVQTLSNNPQVHRDGSNKMHMYVEDATSNGVYVYESTDGIIWTEMASNPAIAAGGVGTWDHKDAVSPTARHDGTRYLVTYEGRTAPKLKDSVGLASGTSANALTKLAANPIWDPVADPFAVGSIVADSWFLDGNGKIIFLCHAGFTDGNFMFRGQTSNLDPLTWVEGDIRTIPGTGEVASGLQSDFTEDRSAGIAGAVSGDATTAKKMLRYRLVDAAVDRPERMVRRPAPNVQRLTASGTWVKPTDPNYTLALVLCIGGGSGGSSGRKGAAASIRGGGPGGGGGALTWFWIPLWKLGATETVTVGAAGTGGAAQTANDSNGNPGIAGGDTAFGLWLRAGGGQPGAGGNATSNPGGVGGRGDKSGAGGGAASATGLVGAAGGNAGLSAGAGGSGGGITTGNAASAGGAGGAVEAVVGVGTAVRAGGLAGAIASDGAITVTPTSVGEDSAGTGGGGGGSSLVGNAGKGGNADKYGGGGGGGGAAVNDVGNSGAGGDGGPGLCVVICE